VVNDGDFSNTRHGTLYFDSKRAVVRPVGPAPTITTGQCCLFGVVAVVEEEKEGTGGSVVVCVAVFV